ncbi:MAG: glycosyltransferase [Flavobacteriaceae bacterium]
MTIDVTQKKYKLCLVNTSLAKGGAERSAAMLSQMLHQEGHEVNLVVLNDEIDFEYKGELFNLGTFKNKGDNSFNRIMRFIKLRQFFKKKKFDFIIDHRPKNSILKELFYKNYLYKGNKTIYVYHTSKIENTVTKFPKLFQRFCANNFANVAVSKYIENNILKKYSLPNTHTIENPFYNNWPGDEMVLPKLFVGKKYILAYGRLVDEIKDYRFLLNAYKASELFLNEIFLVILGDGPDKELLESEIKLLQLEHFVHLLPFVKNPKSIIENAQFVTLTSKYEGFPMVLIESLSLGTPVVSLDIISGPNEIIQHEKNGLLVPERDINLFSRAMQRLIFDKHLQEKCKLEAENSVTSFTFKETIKKWQLILLQ